MATTRSSDRFATRPGRSASAEERDEAAALGYANLAEQPPEAPAKRGRSVLAEEDSFEYITYLESGA